MMKQAVSFVLCGILAVACGGSQSSTQTPAPGGETVAPTSTSPAPQASTDSTASAAGGAGLETALELPCRQLARDVEGEEDSSRLVRCPQGCLDKAGTVWGTDIYTDDSAVCPALIHAGVLPASGGVASITFTRGLRAYVASEQNGIKSKSYGKWRRSFYAQALGDDGRPNTPAATLPDANTARVDCSHRGNFMGSAKGTSLTVICPAGCADARLSVWGSNPYTSDSNVCAAAIHAGTIPASGGRAVLTVDEGKPSYSGSTKNGVVTRKYGKYGQSFTVSAP